MATAAAHRTCPALLLVSGMLTMVPSGWGGSGLPATLTRAPGGPDSPGTGACRTYSTDDTGSIVTKAGPTRAVTTSTVGTKCAFDPSTSELTCSLEVSGPSAYSSIFKFRYRSVGDFVGDAPRIFWYS